MSEKSKNKNRKRSPDFDLMSFAYTRESQVKKKPELNINCFNTCNCINSSNCINNNYVEVVPSRIVLSELTVINNLSNLKIKRNYNNFNNSNNKNSYDKNNYNYKYNSVSKKDKDIIRNNNKENYLRI